MGVIVPVGDAAVSFVVEIAGGSKQMTWGLGFAHVDAVDGPALATACYNGITNGGEGTPAPYYPDVLIDVFTFIGVSVSVMTAPGPLVFDHFDPVPGEFIGHPPVPKNCSALVTKRSSSGGRKNKGRAYVPLTFVGEEDIDGNGVIGPLYVARLSDGLNMFLDLLTDVDLEPVIHHSDGSPGTAITSMDCGSTIATQRRRIR